MSNTNYLEMVEVPVQSCDVIVKPSRKKKKDVKEEVIQKINETSTSVVETDKKQRRKILKPSALYNKIIKPKKKKVTPVESETVTVKSSKFDIVSVQVVAIFVLVVGIILTNIFIEDSGMNNLLRSVFGTETQVISTAEFSAFEPLSPSKTGEISVEDGVMTVSSGSVYSPCDGVVEDVQTIDGKFNVTIRHSQSFTTVISGLELCYNAIGDNVYSNVALGYSGEAMQVSMFDGTSRLTKYSIVDDEIIWLA